MPSFIPLVEIELDKVRHLRLDLNAMVAYERASGKRISDLTAASSMEQMLYLVWACLLHEDRELTVEEVGGLVHAGNLAEVSEALAGAVQVAMPEAKNNPKNRRRSGGISSGPSGDTTSI